ncbi:MAG TPA: hypothetical protein VFB60_06130 [Ktedonobacteraceae bacterium]|nr:hypothetical protein [Ktedonobacteraceae bacterium]
MASEIHASFINYYEHLDVQVDAPVEQVQAAFDTLVSRTLERLNNPLTMQNALYTQNVILPGIQQHLLSGQEARDAYNQQLAAVQQHLATRGEWADDEGLDDELSRPFFFDPFDGYDTEAPAFTLRQIAHKLDSEWPQTVSWMLDASDRNHVFVGFLNMVAGRPGLAKKIEAIIAAVSDKKMPTNEGIERCINILDPEIERPVARLSSPQFDGQVFEAGEFISDLAATTELLLTHEGSRGCTFGTIESRSPWVKFRNGAARVRFALMPDGTDPSIGLSEVKIPLYLQVRDLERNADHSANLVIRIENFAAVYEVPVCLHISIAPLPPRVSFVPPASEQHPLMLKTVLQGEMARATITVKNAGDEQLDPLVGYITSNEQGVSVTPTRFGADEQLTLSIDTARHPRGKIYDVVFNIRYAPSSRAIGPTTLHVRGEILPTFWQSLFRARSAGERVGTGCVTGIAGSVAGLVIGSIAASHAGGWFLLLLAVPALLVWLTRWLTKIILFHLQLAGNTKARIEQIPPGMLWGIPGATGLLLVIVCAIIQDAQTAITIGAFSCLLLGCFPGFIFDQSLSTTSPDATGAGEKISY